MKKTFSVNEDFLNSRLDRWFRKNVCNVPQSLIEKHIRKGNIKINKKKEKSSYKLQSKDQISIYNIKFTEDLNKKKLIRYLPTKKDLSFTNEIFIENNKL